MGTIIHKLSDDCCRISGSQEIPGSQILQDVVATSSYECLGSAEREFESKKRIGGRRRIGYDFRMTAIDKIAGIPWPEVKDLLYARGFASLGQVLDETSCREVVSWYGNDSLFRSRVDMARYRFGRGEYKYFSYPLPGLVAELRERLYKGLAGIATEWMTDLDQPTTFPDELPQFVRTCHASGQRNPTPLLLRYRAEDFNCLHQDLYGEVFFPFQVIVVLNQRGEDYEGGELALVEQRPRAQSTAHVILPLRGEAVVITTRYRPVRGSRGFYRASVRHGVSELRSGDRHTLGIIFHDGK
jgi:hypothetical protein